MEPSLMSLVTPALLLKQMDRVMVSKQRPLESVKKVVLSVRSAATVDDKMALYDIWAENYDQDVVVLGYEAPSHVANILSANFSGDREAAVVLDVACGTGLMAEQMKEIGFKHFVGIDGSKAMLEKAQKKGLYQDLKQSILGKQPLPVQKGSFDVVVMCGALSVDHVTVNVIRELCNACKPGGYVLMTCRHAPENMEYKADLEREQRQMEEEGLWSCVAVNEVENWARSLLAAGNCYLSGSIYNYKRV